MDALRLSELTVGEYRLDLVRPFGTPDHPVTAREGLIVRLVAEDGSEGFGEIAPLAGIHAESLVDARAWLAAFAPKFVGAELRRLRDAMLVEKAPETVMWGIETAQIGRGARQKGEVPARLLDGVVPTHVGVNAIFDGDERDLDRELAHLAPYPAVKIKIGRRGLDVDRAVLARVVAELPHTRLRLDANRLPDLDRATALVANVPTERIEYVEDPVADFADLARFHQATGLAVALDTTRSLENGVVDTPCVTTLVIKPTRLGGPLEAWGLSQRARERGKRVVVSSAVESGLGLSFLAQIAAVVQEDGVAAGIGTDVLLADDIVEPRFDTSSGSVRVADWTGTPSDRFIEETTWTPVGEL